MQTMTHQPHPNAAARVEVATTLAALVPGFDCSSASAMLEALRELPQRHTIVDDHLHEALHRVGQQIAANEYVLAVTGVRQLAKSIESTRVATERAAERAAFVPEPLATITRAAGTARNTGALVDFFAARQLAQRQPEQRLLDLLTRQGDSAELRRCFAASELPHTDVTSPYMPTAADWLEVPTVHTQALLPSWCKALASALNVPADQQRIANALDKLITKHASSGRFLRAYWAHMLRCRIASPGVESLYAPDEFTSALACGALVTGGAS